ncbi:P-loop containing nucleoside triphosphate hydrolase protein [Gaertneriomyces semiglobifer]|nr:P-loop containing nucleoside triphosphate hydrolase protein [Gaertneriomyces semiglobifer]
MTGTPSHHLSPAPCILLVLSGKGGVGKSTTTTHLALSLASSGKSTGVLDIDLTGPSLERMFGVEGTVEMGSEGWTPMSISVPDVEGSTATELKLLSLSFLIPKDEKGAKDQAIIWRGPKKTSIIKQFLTDVLWSTPSTPLDYLLIDTPPGTSDEHISVVETLHNLGLGSHVHAVVVTTPQDVSLSDVKKEINFCKKVGVPILGLIENMSGFKCPCCDEVTPIFSSGGAEKLHDEYGIEILGKIPIDQQLTELMEKGSFVDRFRESSGWKVWENVGENVVRQLNKS